MKVLLATDGSEDAAAAQRFLATLPLPPRSAVHVVSVVNYPLTLAVPSGFPGCDRWELGQRMVEAERSYAEQLLREAASGLSQKPGVETTTEARYGDPAHQILLAAEETGAELIVVGSKGLTGLKGFLIGSVARNVARHATVPVLVARAPRNGLRQLVVATDGSEHSTAAVAFTAQLPLPAESSLTAVSVVQPYEPAFGDTRMPLEALEHAVEEVRRVRRKTADDLAATARSVLQAAGRKVESATPEGDPAEQLLAFAAGKGADLIVAGARGVSPIQALLVGSVADRLLKEAPCSVLLVR